MTGMLSFAPNHVKITCPAKGLIMAETDFPRDVCVIGGGGHVGLPFALICADSGLRTVIYDIDAARWSRSARGVMPFLEEGAEEMLRRALAQRPC